MQNFLFHVISASCLPGVCMQSHEREPATYGCLMKACMYLPPVVYCIHIYMAHYYAERINSPSSDDGWFIDPSVLGRLQLASTSARKQALQSTLAPLHPTPPPPVFISNPRTLLPKDTGTRRCEQRPWRIPFRGTALPMPPPLILRLQSRKPSNLRTKRSG